MVRSVEAETPQHIVAIVGGATAGAEAAAILARQGVDCVIFEQNVRPYGKIEDGLPRWHVRLRRKEYETINQRLSDPHIHFVPLTKIGRDIEFPALAREWGFTAVLLAHGAWRDRRLPIEGAEAFVGRGLVYQNAFIHWFNHFPEDGYTGPQYEIADDTIVVGGGLASIDVMKALQIELVRRLLAERGIAVDMLEIEHAGIPDTLAAHGLDWDTLGLRGATLFYRRRIEDMPLADIPADADEGRRLRFEATRRKILEKAMQKYCFSVRPLMVPVGLIVEGDRLAGLRFQHTRVEAGRPVPIEGEIEEVRAPMVISSIGSIPEPMRGIEQKDHLYSYVDPHLGRLAGYDTVFSTGNVVTGKGNILDSRKHSIAVSTHLIEEFLGLADADHRGEEALLGPIAEGPRDDAGEMAVWVGRQPPIAPEKAREIMARVQERQRQVGYEGSFDEWIRKNSAG